MDRYAVLVFRRDKPLTTQQHLDFTKSLGEIVAVGGKSGVPYDKS